MNESLFKSGIVIFALIIIIVGGARILYEYTGQAQAERLCATLEEEIVTPSYNSLFQNIYCYAENCRVKFGFREGEWEEIYNTCEEMRK